MQKFVTYEESRAVYDNLLHMMANEACTLHARGFEACTMTYPRYQSFREGHRTSMNLSQALEHAQALAIPGLFGTDESLDASRQDNEEAISVLMHEWNQTNVSTEPFSFDIVRSLAERNRALCDDIGVDALRNVSGLNLARHLTDADLIKGAARLQHISEAQIAKEAGMALRNLGTTYAEHGVQGTVVGIDLETTSMYPDRGYIVNVGLMVTELRVDADCSGGYSAYCGIPQQYRTTGVPLAEIHHISWSDVADALPFRQNTALQKALLSALTTYPYMAHNASFEDSWLMLHLDGYAEARRQGAIVPIDTRDLCRRLDPDVRALPRESRPASLENWAYRRGTLKAGQKERHLALDDVSLMMRTVIAEFNVRNMLARTS